MLLDTGSSDIVLFGKGCTTCGNKVYDQTASSSYKYLNKNLTLYYGTGSATGLEATETVTIGGFTQTGVEWGE